MLNRQKIKSGRCSGSYGRTDFVVDSGAPVDSPVTDFNAADFYADFDPELEWRWTSPEGDVPDWAVLADGDRDMKAS